MDTIMAISFIGIMIALICMAVFSAIGTIVCIKTTNKSFKMFKKLMRSYRSVIDQLEKNILDDL